MTLTASTDRSRSVNSANSRRPRSACGRSAQRLLFHSLSPGVGVNSGASATADAQPIYCSQHARGRLSRCAQRAASPRAASSIIVVHRPDAVQQHVQRNMRTRRMRLHRANVRAELCGEQGAVDEEARDKRERVHAIFVPHLALDAAEGPIGGQRAVPKVPAHPRNWRHDDKRCRLL